MLGDNRDAGAVAGQLRVQEGFQRHPPVLALAVWKKEDEEEEKEEEEEEEEEGEKGE